MKKETLIEIILGTIGGLVFAIGMCMCLIPEWNMLKAGIIVAIIGGIILLTILPIHRKAHPKKEKESKQVDVKLIITWCVGVIGALIMGFGMSKVLVDEHTKTDLIVGLVTGIIGLLTCVLNYPIYSYIKSKNN